MYVSLKIEFWIYHIRKLYNAKKATLIVMHDIIFSDHTSQHVEVYELWHLKRVAQHMNRWSYIYSVILWTYRTAFLGNLKTFPSSLPVPRSASQGVTISVSSVHCQLQYLTYIRNTQHLRIKWYSQRYVTLNKYARNFNFHNEMKNTVTSSHTHAALCLSQLH